MSEKIKHLKELNDKVYMRVKNPYLRLFYLIMIDSHFKRKSMVKILSDFNKDYVMNLFDYVAICCKFLDTGPLKDVLEDKIKFDVARGNL